MANFVKVGETLINLDQVTAMYITTDWDAPCVRVAFTDNENFLTFSGDNRDHLLTYMNQQMPLSTYNLRRIQADAFDPFAEELPKTLYSLFQSLPMSEEMVLSLMADGQGGVWLEKVTDQRVENALVHWCTLDEALDKLEAFKNTH